MENKPVFCSECGARLTGSAAFCGKCGAKQPASVSPAPVVAPVAEAAPVVIPAAAPENSLAAPKKNGISVLGLLLVLAAVFFTFITELIQLYQWGLQATYGKFSFGAALNFLRRSENVIGLLTAWVMPILALVFVLVRKKPAAIAGLALAAVTLFLQILLAACYRRFVEGYGVRFPLPRLWMFGYRLVNGESLFRTLRQYSGVHVLFTVFGFRAVFLGLGYYLKNILALLACLMAAVKKAK